MRSSLRPAVLFVCVALAGCETFTRPTQRVEIVQNQVVLIDTIATRRGTYLIRKPKLGQDDERWVLVAEPPPDAALASAVKAAAEVAAKTQAGLDASGKGSLEVTQTLTKLVERTQAVTIARDAYYRLSEAYANGTINQATYEKQFTAVLAVAKDIAEAQKNDSIKEKANAESKLQILSDPQLNEEQKLQKMQMVR